MAKKPTKPSCNEVEEVRSLYTLNTKGRRGKLVNKVGLGNPVVTTANEIASLCNLLGVQTGFDFNTKTISIYVNNADRADAFNRFVNHKIEIGNLYLNVEVWDISLPTPEKCPTPTYTITDAAKLDLWLKIFAGTPLEPEYTKLVDQFDTVWNFFQFADIVIRYQADDLQNPRGFGYKIVVDSIRDVFCPAPGYMLSVM